MSKVLGCSLALFTVPFALVVVGFSVAWLDSGSATVTHRTTVPVGDSPPVSVTMGSGTLRVSQGSPGSLVLVERDGARGLLRPSVERALNQMHTAVRGGYGLGVQIDVPDEPPTFQDAAFGGPVNEERDLTLQVPSGTALRVSGGTLVELDHLDGKVQVFAPLGLVRLDHVRATDKSYIEVARGGIAGTLTMAGGRVDLTAGTGGVQLQLLSPGGTHLHAATGNGSIELPESFHLTPSKFGSGSSVDGAIAGSGPGGQLTISTDNGVITVH